MFLPLTFCMIHMTSLWRVEWIHLLKKLPPYPTDNPLTAFGKSFSTYSVGAEVVSRNNFWSRGISLLYSVSARNTALVSDLSTMFLFLSLLINAPSFFFAVSSRIIRTLKGWELKLEGARCAVSKISISNSSGIFLAGSKCF